MTTISGTKRRWAATALAAALAAHVFGIAPWAVSEAEAQSTVRSQLAFVKVRGDYSHVVFCHGFGCHFETRVQFGASQLGKLNEIMATGTASPAHEREAVKQAVAYFETYAATIAGTEKDIAGNYTIGGDPGQLDCVDEARNTTRLLLLLQKHGLLKHHTVDRIRGRGTLIDGRYPHNTAVLREKSGGVRWTVDSWMRHNGDVPEVMTLERWLRSGYS